MVMVDVDTIVASSGRPAAQVDLCGPMVVGQLSLFCIHQINQVNSRYSKHCGANAHQTNCTVCSQWLATIQRCRHDRVVIIRLRIGHTRLTSHLLKGENQPECQVCQSVLTVKHILIDCTHLSAVHQRYFRVDTLKELFEIVDSRNIIAFIKDINFYTYNPYFILGK